VTNLFASGFFHESSSAKSLKITLGSFQIFSKIRRDICKSWCTTGINDTGGNINDTGGYFSSVTAGVVDTGGGAP
jgi:hypothetical protein